MFTQSDWQISESSQQELTDLGTDLKISRALSYLLKEELWVTHHMLHITHQNKLQLTVLCRTGSSVKLWVFLLSTAWVHLRTKPVSFDHKPTLIDSPAQQPSPMGLLVLPLSQISIHYTVKPRCTNALANWSGCPEKKFKKTSCFFGGGFKQGLLLFVCVCVLSLFWLFESVICWF